MNSNIALDDDVFAADQFKTVLVASSHYPVPDCSEYKYSKIYSNYLCKALIRKLNGSTNAIRYSVLEAYLPYLLTSQTPMSQVDFLVHVCSRGSGQKIISNVDLIEYSSDYMILSHTIMQSRDRFEVNEEVIDPIVESIARFCRIPSTYFDEGMVSSMRLAAN